MSQIFSSQKNCDDFIELGYLADPASVDLASANKCAVTEVLVDKVSYAVSFPVNWTVTQLVNAVNAITPNTLSLSGTTVASATGKTISNLEIVCELPDFVEGFVNPPAGSFLPLATGTINPGASTTYGFLNDGGFLGPFGTYTIARASQLRFAATAPVRVDALGNPNGGVLAINGDDQPGDFYKQTATGLIIGQEYEFSAYIANGETGVSGLPGPYPVATSPDVTFRIETTSGTLIGSANTGPITASGWRRYNYKFVSPATSLNYILRNNSPVTGGNDLVMDEIHFSRVNRQHFTLLPRDRVIPVEIHKQICDGVVSVKQVVSSDGLTIYTIPDPTGLILVAGAPIISSSSSSGVTQSTSIQSEILCDTVTSFLRTYTTSGGVVTVSDTTLDGLTPYSPVGTVGVCTPASVGTEIDVVYSTSSVICVTNVGVSTPWFVRQRNLVNNSTGNITSTITEYSLDGSTWTAVIPTGTIVAGDCPCTQTNPLIDSTFARQTGVGTQTIAAGARSVTVTVVSGTPTLSISGAGAINLVAGLTQTWSVDNGGLAGESLQDSFVFAGIAGSDFFVSSTREI